MTNNTIPGATIPGADNGLREALRNLKTQSDKAAPLVEPAKVALNSIEVSNTAASENTAQLASVGRAAVAREDAAKSFLDVAGKLLPKTVIAAGTATSLAITAAFNEEACTGVLELIVRSIVFGVLLIFGLWTMNWRYWTDHHFSHGVINLLVVSTWLLALQAKPFSCWLNDGNAINEDSIRALTALQVAALVVVTAVATYAETRLSSRE